MRKDGAAGDWMVTPKEFEEEYTVLAWTLEIEQKL